VWIWTLPVKGEPAVVPAEEMERLRQTHELWRGLELEALGKLLLPEPAPDSREPDPVPTANVGAALAVEVISSKIDALGPKT
jgi:hypothetical protein